jgi:hypothetical protein
MKSTFTTKFQFTLIATFLVLFAAVSCKNKATSNASQISDETIKQEIEEYTYPIPSVFDVTEMLNQIEASYISGIANDPTKAEKYFSEKAKALNLGIYTADLAYSTTYNQKVDIQNYFKAIETLVTDISLKPAFKSDLPNQIEANIDNKAKLVEVVTGMFQDAYSYLNNQDRSEISYLILAGTVVEGLYLTCNLSENTFQNPKLVEAILYQKDPLMKLEGLMLGYSESELTSAVLEDIQSLNAIYGQQEGSNSITEEQVKALTEALNKIRASYIQ